MKSRRTTAPANANLEYNAKPLSLSGVEALVLWTMASSFVDPVDEGGGDAAIAVIDLDRCSNYAVANKVLNEYSLYQRSQERRGWFNRMVYSSCET